MFDDDLTSAKDFFTRIIAQDVLLVKTLFNRISKAPSPAQRYLERHCRDDHELEEFFRDNDYLFYFENKRVALFDDQLERASERTVEFFKEKLKRCGKPVDYMELKTRFLEHAARNVCLFVTQFYPGREIKNFFRKYPDTFVVHKDHTVFLVEVDSVEFYKRKLKAEPGQKADNFLKFRGHIGQAAPHVQNYMNRNFLGGDFQIFLIRHNDVFNLDDDGTVRLVASQ